jgi:triosephosphate isomerase
MRKKIAAGNWKMNKTLDEGLTLASEIVNMANDEVSSKVTVIVAPPYIHLASLSKMIKGDKNIFLGAQNCSDKSSGAFTGEISAPMLKSIGVQYVIIGHSERREYYHESNQFLASKVKIALENGLTPIFCCGEPLEIREKGTHIEYVKKQVTESLFDLDASQMTQLVVAYEPIWAIGTGKTASTEQAQEMHKEIRDHLNQKFGAKVADEISILYGGSVKADNAQELFSQPDVDGGLIGGASLKSRDFVDIAKSFGV